ncbi:hypothetical protein BDW22DRAFT_1391432 [Trametopsis cervina]|nr:hypothetical protein BDW22DRAFT_1391432 [Trametopsis cervina]
MDMDGLIRRRLQPVTYVFTSNRILWYGLLSTAATAATIANACKNYSNFYSVAVYLSRSGRSLLVLANFGFIVALVSGSILQRIFFGPLQPREVERLYDQTWMFVTESLLAFTIFRDDFDIPFVIMFGFLLFIKCFHWLLGDRVESMDQVPYPGPPTLFHIRLHSLFLILWLVDIVMLFVAIDSTLSSGVGGAVLFANEYAILTASALNSMARYILSTFELRRASTRGGANAPAWDNKSMYIFYIELVTDFLKLATYLTFFAVVLTFYGLPLNIIRDVYLTARSFITRLRALVRYHNATRDMDRRYPNATEEELRAMSDRTCIICRDELIAATNDQNHSENGNPPNNAPNAQQVQDGPNVTPKKLPCGHIFHFQCLRSWLERQQSCPTCRRTVLETDQPTGNNAQAGQRAARPPGQQPPNVAPQAPPVAGQQQPQPPAPINGGGWFGRVMGFLVPPPLIPGQFANAPVPPQFVPAGPQAQPQIPANAGWGPQGQPPLGYAYPPYAYPPIPPQQLQQLQPPPVYRGFYGPGGVWYPFAPDAQDVHQGQQPPVQQAQQPAASQTSPSAPESSGSAVTPAPAAESTPTAAETRPSGEPIAEASTPSPREAAALAALRRFNSSQNTPGTRASESRPAEATNTTAPPNGAPTPTTAPPPAAAANPRAQAPPLIPLWDPLQHAQQVRAPLYPWQQAPVAIPLPQPGQQGVNGSAVQPHGAPGFAQPASARPPPVLTSARQSDVPREPLSQLPAILSEEQLTRLDRLTRDAIDERLKVLEGVSGTLWRCIIELHRMRSVLPPGQDLNAEGSGGSARQVDTTSQLTTTEKGKGVSTDNNTPAEPQPSSSSSSSSSVSRQARQMDILD